MVSNYHDKQKKIKSYILLFCIAQDLDQAMSYIIQFSTGG